MSPSTRSHEPGLNCHTPGVTNTEPKSPSLLYHILSSRRTVCANGHSTTTSQPSPHQHESFVVHLHDMTRMIYIFASECGVRPFVFIIFSSSFASSSVGRQNLLQNTIVHMYFYNCTIVTVSQDVCFQISLVIPNFDWPIRQRKGFCCSCIWLERKKYTILLVIIGVLHCSSFTERKIK